MHRFEPNFEVMSRFAELFWSDPNIVLIEFLLRGDVSGACI